MTRATPDPDRPRPIPGRIGGVLKVLATLIAHARYFVATAATRAAVPEFLTVAAVFGTHEIPVILDRVQRGLLRALALQRYLLDRAARGRNLRFAWPPRVELQPRHCPPARPAPDPARAPKRNANPERLGADDPTASHMPTQEEIDAWVRRRPVGRTMVYICTDLGIVPGLCDGAFWNRVEKVFRRYGGSLNRLCQVREAREVTFQQERDKRPETWDTDWRDLRPETVRRALGCRIGETAPDAQWSVPVAVPS